MCETRHTPQETILEYVRELEHLEAVEIFELLQEMLVEAIDTVKAPDDYCRY